MTAVRAAERVTPAEYLVRERRAQTKSEYLGGFIVAMSGASRLHNYVVGDIFVELHQQLRDRPCDEFSNDMRVKIAEAGAKPTPMSLWRAARLRSGTPSSIRSSRRP